MMDSFVAVAIHDAKNALAALNAWLDEARRECPSSPSLAKAQDVAGRVSAQLVELLALYRADQGTLRLSIADRDLGDFLADVLAELGPLPADIALETAFDEALGSWAFDAYLVKFVLLDALRNALRHATARVRFELAAAPGGGIRFAVADDGPGFPADVLAGREAAMSESSSGLGLQFARIVAVHHATPAGRVGRVELANDGGAVFALVLP